jgi:RHS repeat-associated protein
MTAKSGIADQVINLPKGGGSIRGIGETFRPDLHTGTGNFSIPIAVPPGRTGFQPQLTLAYSTGNGNGPFGIGWSLGVPGVTRKTSKGVPTYEGADTYILSGAEDLVLVREEVVHPDALDPTREETHRYYRPRTEGLFALIVHVTGNGKDHWEVTSKSGITSFYGRDAASRLYDEDAREKYAIEKVFQWLLCETDDPNGNRISYTYKREDGAGLEGRRYEAGRSYNQLYLSKVEYANYWFNGEERYLFSVEFDYGEYDGAGSATGAWAYRPDPFSTYRAGFEVRTVRRCHSILAKVHEEGAPAGGRLIKSYRLRYIDELSSDDRAGEHLPRNGASLLADVALVGHREEEGQRIENAFPPVGFRYTRFDAERRRYEPFTARLGSLPERALNAPDYELVDLHGHGLPDVVHTSPNGFRYWRNLGGCRFDALHPMHRSPAGVSLAQQGVQFADMEGNGTADLLIADGSLTGYYPTTFDANWDARSFVAYKRAPSINLEDSDVRLVDIDGDGVIDAVDTSSPSHVAVFYNRGRKGWDTKPQRVARRQLAEFPDVSFSAPEQRVRLAAMGGGMQDVVAISGSRIDYWPNFGHGSFGTRITMANSPNLPHNYDPKRLFLADVDGDGYADLIYVDFGRVHYWINQSGNAWSEEHVIEGTPPISDHDAVRIADMKGTGTAGILWTYDWSPRIGSNYKYLDLTGEVKPYLLAEIDNRLGATTKVSYAPSTKFYLKDMHEYRPWKTHLPFPVHVVEQVEVIDHLSKGKVVTRYAYHHGYWDGEEREFRGFGFVEQYDTESFTVYHGSGLHGTAGGFQPILEKHYSPPTLTKTWFHVGRAIDFWDGVGETSGLAALPAGLDPEATRHALRTLRGSILRTELYALDGSQLETSPYTVTENSYRVELAARGLDGARSEHASFVFFPHLHEIVTRDFERGSEPRVNRIISSYNQFGSVTKQIKIGEPREPAEPEDLLVLVADTTFALDHPQGTYIKDRVAETVTLDPSRADRALIDRYLKGREEPDWEEIGTAGPKVLGRTRNYYDGAPEQAYQGLSLGQLDRGNLVRTELLALTDEILTAAYATPPTGSHPEPPAAMTDLEALHYTKDAGGYWVQSDRRKYDFQEPQAGSSFGLVVGVKGPNGNESSIAFGRPYRIFPVAATDAIGLSTTVDYDYQSLAPRRQVDPNGNETEYGFDALGMVIRIALKGKRKNGVWEGDELARPTWQFEYNLRAFADLGQPVHAHTLQREVHRGSTFFETWEYFDGFGRTLQGKVEAEPISKPNVDSGPRWVGSGWQVYNNKGWVVERYEPFFSSTRAYEEDALSGVHSTIHYDPLGRVVLSVNPDGSFRQLICGSLTDVTDPEGLRPNPWETSTYDENDNGALLCNAEGSRLPRTEEEIDTLKLRGHLATPNGELQDAWGRRVVSWEDNGVIDGARQIHRTRFSIDLLGRPVAITDGKGRVALRQTHDLLGNVLRAYSIDAGDTTYVFDASGNVVEQRDAKGAVALSEYDALNRRIAVRARDGDGQTIGLRELHLHDRLPVTTQGQAQQNNSLGRSVQTYDGAGRLDFDAYDFKGNLVQKTRLVVKDSVDETVWPDTTKERDSLLKNARHFVIRSTYDALNRVVELVHPDGTLLRQFYNSGNLLEQIEVGDQLYVSSIDYNEKGQRSSILYGNGVSTSYTYDALTFRLSGLLTRKPNGASIQDLAYTYDLVGNVLRVSDRSETRMENGQPYIANPREYTYDPLYRLVSSTGNERKNIDNFTPPDAEFVPTPDVNAYQPYERRYAYDEVGSLLFERSMRKGNRWTNNYSHHEATNRLAQTQRGSAGPIIPYRFDGNGNMVGMMTNWRYFWDYADRMKGLENRPEGSSPTIQARYFYDATGLRVKKVVRKGNITETTVYIDGLFEEFVRKLGNSVKEQKQLKHLLEAAGRVAIIKTIVVATEADAEPPILYQHGDHLESSHALTKEDGSFFKQEEYYPYGASSFGSYAHKRYRFTGQERDEESGLYYQGARYYASWLQRWTSADPAGIVDGLNLYAYARSNPIRLMDSTGTQADEPSEYARQLARPQSVRNKTGWENILKPVNPIRIENMARLDAEHTESIVESKKMIQAAQISAEVSLMFLPGSGLLSKLPKGVQAVPGVLGAAATGIGLGEAITGTSITGHELSTKERISQGLQSGIGFAQMALGAVRHRLAQIRAIPTSPGTVSVSSGAGGTWGELPPTAAAKSYADRLVRAGDLVPLERGSLSLRDLGTLASSQKAEFAIIRIKGQRFVLRGESSAMEIPKGAKLIAHVHPGEGFMGLAPSSADTSALEQFKQKVSTLINEVGAWRTFTELGGSPFVRNYASGQ